MLGMLVIGSTRDEGLQGRSFPQCTAQCRRRESRRQQLLGGRQQSGRAGPRAMQEAGLTPCGLVSGDFTDHPVWTGAATGHLWQGNTDGNTVLHTQALREGNTEFR